MFTGIVNAMGTVRSAVTGPDGLTLTIETPYRRVHIGESVAIDGVCLTVEQGKAGVLSFHAIGTTLERTLLRKYAAGRPVNLERAVRAGDRLGGHLVQGHVDGIGTVTTRRQDGDAWLFDIEVPPAVAKVSVPLGSIAIDGVSLTVNAIPAPGTVQISLIPFTFEHTTLGRLTPGAEVHVEADAIGKYVAALLDERGRSNSARTP
ncbi:MAG: riboflavin synthase [Gemmatimonadota bacterium]